MLLPWRGQPFHYAGRGGCDCDQSMWIVTLFSCRVVGSLKSCLALLAVEGPAIDANRLGLVINNVDNAVVAGGKCSILHVQATPTDLQCLFLRSWSLAELFLFSLDQHASKTLIHIIAFQGVYSRPFQKGFTPVCASWIMDAWTPECGELFCHTRLGKVYKVS